MIPYTAERRADTGVNNVTMGIWLFLASEVMLFGSLFSAYALLRYAATDWPAGLTVLSLNLGLANTVLLVITTATVWQARRAAIPAARRQLLVGCALSLAFLVLKSIEYHGEINRGLVPSVSNFVAMYFTLTGLHALHVLGGLVANLWVVRGANTVGEAMTRGRIHALTLYWAFVDVVWVLILLTMYVF